MCCCNCACNGKGQTEKVVEPMVNNIIQFQKEVHANVRSLNSPKSVEQMLNEILRYQKLLHIELTALK